MATDIKCTCNIRDSIISRCRLKRWWSCYLKGLWAQEFNTTENSLMRFGLLRWEHCRFNHCYSSVFSGRAVLPLLHTCFDIKWYQMTWNSRCGSSFDFVDFPNVSLIVMPPILAVSFSRARITKEAIALAYGLRCWIFVLEGCALLIGAIVKGSLQSAWAENLESLGAATRLSTTSSLFFHNPKYEPLTLWSAQRIIGVPKLSIQWFVWGTPLCNNLLFNTSIS